MNKIKAIALSTSLALTALVAVPSLASAAGSASLSLSPSGGSRTVGSSFSVAVVENSGGTAINGVEADVNYDASKLRLIGKSCGGAFDITAPAGGSNLACATVTAKSGVQTVGSFSFKVIATGSGAISILPSSQITASDGAGTNVWNGAASSASFSFANPVPVAAQPVTPTPAPAPVVKKAAVAKTPITRTPATIKEGTPAWQALAAWIAFIVGSLAFIFKQFEKPIMAKVKKDYKGLHKFLKKEVSVKGLARS